MTPDEMVVSPEHYKFMGREVKDFIQDSLSRVEFRGYLKGNILKYRLRAGKKYDTTQDIQKAMQYEKMLKEFNDIVTEVGEFDGLRIREEPG